MKRAVVYIAAVAVTFIVYRVYSGTSGKTSFFDSATLDANLAMSLLNSTPASQMGFSQDGLERLKNREGFSAYSYPDANGRSIGYGHFIKLTDSIPEPVSEDDALALLAQDALTAANAVRAYVTVPLTQSQFDALTSFVYNVGVGAFKRSTMLTVLNGGYYDAAALQFDSWHLPASVISRRNSEKQQFLA
jgi:lysozyme